MRPPIYHPARYLPRFHWELLACGVRGHLLVGRDVAQLAERDRVVVFERDGVRWHRCLRCDAWTPLPPPAAPTRERMPAREEIALPTRGRALRDMIVLRLIAIDRLIHFLLLGLLAIGVVVFANDQARLRRLYDTVVRAVEGVRSGPLPVHHGLLGEADRLVHASSTTLYLIAGGLGIYALVEGVEAVGLWLMRRWAEYLTFVATSAFLPYELWELIGSITVFKVVATVLNLAIISYLLLSKRLFGLRGGAAAEERLRYAESGWDALDRSLPGDGP
ncbi:MAG: hypothetical protein QOI17_630 [Gaiellales bacterium]|nr:hypothetical protein [Gaiellales bacterium]